MHDEETILTHWPFVRAHLALDRRPAWLRLLDFMAEQQAKTLEPTAISAGWLRRWGMTPGEAGRARTVAGELQRAAVLHRWRGAGPRPDVWALTARIERWRVPWTTSARAVWLVIGTCECRARFAEAARFPGQEGCEAARNRPFGANFALPASAHQDIRDPFRAAFDKRRAAFANDTPCDQDLQLVRARLSAGLDAPPTVLSRSTSSSWEGRGEDEEEEEGARSAEGRLLVDAVVAATGQPLFGAPARELDAVAEAAGERVGQLAAELRRQTTIRHAAVLARLAPSLLAQLGRQPGRPEDPDRLLVSRIRALRLAGEDAEADALEAQLHRDVAAVG